MRTPKEFVLIQTAVLIIAVAIYAGIKLLPVVDKTSVNKRESSFVARVVDGDTLRLSDGRKVRLIGVDTPEVHYSEKLLRDSKRTHKDVDVIRSLGRRSADFTRRLCEGKAIKIEKDITKLDRYGRILGYVYLEDGIFVNAEIIKEGYGQVMTIPPNVKYSEYFYNLQREARNKRIGLWADTDVM
jgi:micrococcal nuclease